MDVTSARTAVDAWLRALAAPIPPPARKAVPGPAEPDAAPPRRQWPYGHGPVDVAAALAPLLAPPGTVHLP